MDFLERLGVFPIRCQRVVILQAKAILHPQYGKLRIAATDDEKDTKQVEIKSMMTEVYEFQSRSPACAEELARQIASGLLGNPVANIVALVLDINHGIQYPELCQAALKSFMAVLNYLTEYVGHVRHLEVIAPNKARASFSIPRYTADGGAGYRDNCNFRLSVIQAAIRWHMETPEQEHRLRWTDPSVLSRLRTDVPDHGRLLGVFYPVEHLWYKARSTNPSEMHSVCTRVQGRFELLTNHYGYLADRVYAFIRRLTSSLYFDDYIRDRIRSRVELANFDRLVDCTISLVVAGSRLVLSTTPPMLENLKYHGKDNPAMCDDLSRLSSTTLRSLSVRFLGRSDGKKPLSLLPKSCDVPNLRSLCIIGAKDALHGEQCVTIDCFGVPNLEIISLEGFKGQLHNAPFGKPFAGKIVLSSPRRLMAPSIGVKPTPNALEVLYCRVGDAESLKTLLAGTGAPGDAIDARLLVHLKVIIIIDTETKVVPLDHRPLIGMGSAGSKIDTLHLENAKVSLNAVPLPCLSKLILRSCTLLDWGTYTLPPNTVLLDCHDGTYPIPNQGRYPRHEG